MPTENRDRRVRPIHQLRKEVLGLTFEELADRTHRAGGSDWPKLSKVYSVCMTATFDALLEAGLRDPAALYGGLTVREILASMDGGRRVELQEAINAAVTGAKGRPRRPHPYPGRW